MNKIVNNTLRLMTLWAKIEIIAALVLTVSILGYALFPKESQTTTQSFEEVPSIRQP
ncbi:hypothetical protein [Cyanothece sp. BG0011]|uniref:hypothetical protein n=1 Tax=Cyanothece sp. BG0011 TaxID=2082950 RepID=UPI0018E56680|nr:hypothetical protein [Cyanothece sp. BG0011]